MMKATCLENVGDFDVGRTKKSKLNNEIVR